MIVTPIPTRRTVAGVATILIAAGLIHLLGAKPMDGRGLAEDHSQEAPEPAVKARALEDLIASHAEHPIQASAIGSETERADPMRDGDRDPEWLKFERTKGSVAALIGSSGTWPGMLYRHVDLNPADVYIPKVYRDSFNALWKMHCERIREVGRILLHAEIADMDEQIAAGNFWFEEGFHYGEYPPGMTPPSKDPSDTRRPWYCTGGRQPLSEYGIGSRIVDGKMLSVDGVHMNRSKPATQYWRHLQETQAGVTVAWFAAVGCLSGTRANEIIAECMTRNRHAKTSPSSSPTNANQEPRK